MNISHLMAVAFAIYWLVDLARTLYIPSTEGFKLFAAGARLVIMGMIWFFYLTSL
jgi:hypothetical protein